MRAASSTDSDSRSAGPRPFSVSIDSIDFERVADRAPERRVHRGDQRLGPHAGQFAGGDERLRPAPGRRLRVFMNAPSPHFTSSTRPPMPSAIFLLMIEAVMSGMLSTVPVTSRSA